MALYKDVSDGSSLDDARLRWRRSIIVCRTLGGDATLSWNSTIGSRNQRMGGIVQLRGLFAVRETQVLAQSFSARFPFPTRIVEQLAYGKDLKGGAPPRE